MTLKQLIALGPDGADRLRGQAAAGDLSAAKHYLLWAAWRRIDQARGYSLKAKMRVLSALGSELEVRWRTTSS